MNLLIFQSEQGMTEGSGIDTSSMGFPSFRDAGIQAAGEYSYPRDETGTQKKS